jgi:hypothetical protein
MFSNTRLHSVSVIAASLLGIAAFASAIPASAQPTAQQADAAKRQAAFAACRREADIAVPTSTLKTEQDEMNHYLFFSVCLEKRGYTLGVNARGQ